MLAILNNNPSAIIVLPEIYGINRHIATVCRAYARSGFDVICPGFGGADLSFDYGREDQAYRYFYEHVGFALMVRETESILKETRAAYKLVFLLGFSVGATTAWLCSGQENTADAIIGYYGSRIRDYPRVVPRCPVLLFFTREEKSAAMAGLPSVLAQKDNVTVHLLDGRHGFADPFGPNYRAPSCRAAKTLAAAFLRQIRSRKAAPGD